MFIRMYSMDKLRSIAVDINQQLHRPHLLYDECFNGIAYDEETDRILLTGKNWPVMFDVEFK